MPEFFVRSRHLAIHVDDQDDLLEYRRRLDDSSWPVEMQIQHETIESIYTHDPNGYMVEITRAMRPVTPQEDLDANLTIDALLDVVAEPEPSFGKLLARKAELIVERAADWELEQTQVTALYVLDVPENTSVAKVAAEAGAAVGKVGPYFEITADGVDRHRPSRHRLPARGLVQLRGRRRERADRAARQGRPAGRPGMSAPTRLGAGRYIAVDERPAATATSVHELTTADGATVRGVLATVPGARTVVCLMHPRQDVTHHALVPQLLAAGAAVWTQHTRSVNNDLTLVHEQALLDVAAGMVFLRERGYSSIVPLGHSGGGTLFAFYLEQAGLAGVDRIATTPGGRPTALADATMPTVDGVVFLAPHPGQGRAAARLHRPLGRRRDRPARRRCPSSTRSTRATASPSRPPARRTAAEFLDALPGGAASTGSPASTRGPASTSPAPRRPAPRTSARVRRRIVVGPWRPGSSRSSAPTPIPARSTSRSTPATGPTARSSAPGPTSSTTDRSASVA